MIYINKNKAINFKHITLQSDNGDRRATVCELVVLSECSKGTFPVVLSEGVAFCHPNDNFDKAQGRKIALVKALKNSGFEKDLRTQYWNAYLSR